MPGKKSSSPRTGSASSGEHVGKTDNYSDSYQEHEQVSYRAKEIIFEEGDPGYGAYRVLEGEIEVTKKGEQGRVVLARLGPGSVFGEMSLIDRWPRSATVRAVTDVRLIYVDPETYKRELSRASQIIRELIAAFSFRLRGTDRTVVRLTDEEIKQRRVAELSREELAVITHLAHTGAYLQNIFAWEKACDIIRESLIWLEFKELKFSTRSGKVRRKNQVKLLAAEKKGDRYELQFHGGTRQGKLRLLAPPGKLKNRYRDILLVYNGLLSSCLAKSAAYEVFTSISNQVKEYISETHIQQVFEDFKNSIEQFSARCTDSLMTMPERISAGEKIEDITFDLTMEFQEIDRLGQEVELIKRVFENILRLSEGQLPTEISDQDKDIIKRGDQKTVDEILSSDDQD